MDNKTNNEQYARLPIQMVTGSFNFDGCTGVSGLTMSGADPTPRQNFIQKKVYYGKEIWDFFVGKRLKSFSVDETLYSLRVEFQSGEVCIVEIDADCCSQGWWHTFNNVSAIMSGEIQSVSENTTEAPSSFQDEDVIYSIVFTPVGGYYNCEISHRNTSNGYYGNSTSMTVGDKDAKWKSISGNCAIMPESSGSKWD